MKMNNLAFAIFLLAGTSGVSMAQAAERTTADLTINNGAAVQDKVDANPAVSASDSSAIPDAPSSTTQPMPAAAQPEVNQQLSVTTAPPVVSLQEKPAAAVAPPAENTPADAEPSTGTSKPAAAPQAVHPDTPQPPAQTPAPSSEASFTPQQEARIGEMVKEYLLTHPELLIEVDQKLQKIQYDEQIAAMTAAVLQHQDELLNNAAVPAIGPADAKVALVEFFDYQCAVCARQAPIIQSLVKANPQVRFIFQEWPIFGARWKPSFKAAETGLRIWQQKGGDAYMNYHNAVFATGHIEGELTQKDITKAAVAAGKLKARDNDMLDTLSRSDILAKNLGFQGTPAIVVLPTSGATADNVTLFPGGAIESQLQEAINHASAAGAAAE